MFYTKSGPSTHRKDNQLRSALNVGANPGQSKGPERDMASAPCLMSGGQFGSQAPAKGWWRQRAVARAFTTEQASRACPFAEKEGQGSGRMTSFSPQAKKKPEQSGLCSGVVREMGVEPTLQRNWFLKVMSPWWKIRKKAFSGSRRLPAASGRIGDTVQTESCDGKAGSVFGRKNVCSTESAFVHRYCTASIYSKIQRVLAPLMS